jgi:hypothetical protein
MFPRLVVPKVLLGSADLAIRNELVELVAILSQRASLLINNQEGSS